jgi:hypothetical protein
MQDLPDAVVFSRSDARARGLSDAALNRMVRAGEVVRLRRDQFARWTVDPHLAAALAATRAVRHSTVSHRWAAHLTDLPLLAALPDHVELTVQPTGTGDATSARVHRAALPAADMTIMHGVPVTAPARTALDVARSRPVSEAVAVLDAVLQRGLATSAELDAVALRCWNWPGIGRAQRALRLIDPLAESPLESLSRLLFGNLRLPRPSTQVTIRSGGMFVGRTDFYWDEFGVVGEADGRSKYDSRQVLVDEKARQEALENLGLIVVRWGWDDVTKRPRALKARLEAAFERGYLRDRSGLPRLWSLGSACRTS